MMINALNNVRSVKETVIRHMDEPKYKLMLYRTGPINVTSTDVRISPARHGQTNRSKNTSVLLILFYGWSLLICLKSKWSRDSNITKQTESISFWKSILCVIYMYYYMYWWQLRVALEVGSIEIHENTDYGNRQYVLLMH